MATIRTDKVVTDVSQTIDGQKKVVKGYENMEKASKKSGSSLLQTAANLSLAYQGVSKVFNQLSQATEKYVKVAEVQQLSDARLESIAKKVTKATDLQIESLKKLADTTQELTTFGDEVVQVGQSQLLSYGLQTESVEQLTMSMADLLAQQNGLNATGDNARNIADLLGRAYSGQVGALTRVGIRLDDVQKELLKTGDEMTRVNTLVEIVNQNYGGLAESLADTDVGGIKQIENAIGDLEEEIGEELTPVVLEMKRALLETMRLITPIIKGVINISKSSGSDLSRAIREFRQYEDAYRDIAKTLSRKELQSLLDQLNERISDPGFFDTQATIKNLEDLRKIIESAQFGKNYKELAQGLKVVKQEIKEINDESVASTEFKDLMSIDDEELKELEEQADIFRFTKEEIQKTNEEFADKEIQLEKDKQDLINELREQAWEEEQQRQQEALDNIQNALSVISNLQSGINNIFSQMSTNRMIEIDNEYKADKKRIEDTIKDETKKAKALEKLDTEFQKEKREQQKKNAENEKIAALFQVAINTASAVVEALPNIPLSIAVGALGLAQAGVIASQPVPEFATGVVDLNGVGTTTSDSNLARLSNRESVVTAAGTMAGDNATILREMNGGESFSNATKDLRNIENRLSGLTAVIANQEREINIVNEANRDGFTTMVQVGNGDFTNENNRIEQESAI